MSGAQTPGPLEWQQRYSDTYEALQTSLDRRQAQIHTSMPGHIVSFDPKTMTATVQPALQAFHRQVDGTRQPTTIRPIADVPVHFPSGGGYTLTFPVKTGDECLITFTERSIDNWHQHGGIQQPSDWRLHDINDAVVHVGLRSQPNVVPNVHPDHVQLRADDGKTFIELAGGDIVRIAAPGGVEIDAPTVRVTGDVIAGTVSLRGHRHTDPQGGIVGPPVL